MEKLIKITGQLSDESVPAITGEEFEVVKKYANKIMEETGIKVTVQEFFVKYADKN